MSWIVYEWIGLRWIETVSVHPVEATRTMGEEAVR